MSFYPTRFALRFFLLLFAMFGFAMGPGYAQPAKTHVTIVKTTSGGPSPKILIRNEDGQFVAMTKKAGLGVRQAKKTARQQQGRSPEVTQNGVRIVNQSYILGVRFS